MDAGNFLVINVVLVVVVDSVPALAVGTIQSEGILKLGVNAAEVGTTLGAIVVHQRLAFVVELLQVAAVRH